MLDSFIYGDVSRISPEGPIPILAQTREEKMLGGAGNVFANLRGMGCNVDFISLLGHDGAGHEITDRVEDMGGDTSGLFTDANRPTILKTRYIAKNQQLLRVDQEQTHKLDKDLEEKIIAYVTKIIGTMQVVILSDYGKGLLTPSLIKSIITLAKKNKTPVIVDPKGKDFSIYKGANIVTPNRAELSAATDNADTSSDATIEVAAKILMKQSGIENVIATRSEQGMSVIPKRGAVVHLPTQAQEVYDVSGAGDTVVAAIAAVIAVGGGLEQAAMVGNVAGGLSVAKVGTAIIRADELLSALDNIPDRNTTPSQNTMAVIANQEMAIDQIKKWQANGVKVGFTNGCFDILHYGHVNYLNQARAKCDRLVVGLNHDKSVKILKGEGRPINDEMARATVMAALSSVDMVVFFGAEDIGEDNTPCTIVGALKPDILMKGGDYTIDQLPEAKVVLSYGGQVDIMPLYEGYSTTNIIKKSKQGATR